LIIVHRMALIAPQDYRLNLDKAVLYARLDQVHAAIDNIKIYIDNTAEPYDRQEAQDFLNQLRLRLN
jgi:regulator of sirC expression with transglutaminase-like and TPR domain